MKLNWLHEDKKDPKEETKSRVADEKARQEVEDILNNGSEDPDDFDRDQFRNDMKEFLKDIDQKD